MMNSDNRYTIDMYDPKMIYRDPRYLLKVAESEQISVYDVCRYLRDNHVQPFPFGTNRIWYNYYDDNSKQINEVYQYAVTNGIRATSRRYNLVTANGAFNINYLKGYFAYYGKDLNVFKRNRSKYVSKNQSKLISDYLSRQQIKTLINNLEHNAENRSLDDVYLYDVLGKTRFDASISIPPAVIRYLDKHHLKYRRRTVEEGTSKAEQQQYRDWVVQWQNKVDKLIDQGYSVAEIRYKYMSNKTQVYFPIDRYIKEYRKDYQSTALISQRLYYKYGEKGLTNPTQASAVKQKERSILHAKYQSKLAQQIKSGREQLLELFGSEQQVKRMIRKYGLNSHDIGQLSRSRNDNIRFAFDHWFLKKYPEYRIEQTPYSTYVCRDLRRITSRRMQYSLLVKKLLAKLASKYQFDMSKINLLVMRNNHYRKELYYAYLIRELVRNSQAFDELITILHSRYHYGAKTIYYLLYPKGTLRVTQRRYIEQAIRILDYRDILQTKGYTKGQIKLLLALADYDKQKLFQYSSAAKFIAEHTKYQQFDTAVISHTLWKLQQFEFQEHNQSAFEQQVYTYLLDNLGLIENQDFILHDRSIIRPRELDFVFPDMKLAIELNPIYTHNSTAGSVFSTNGNDPKEITYHQDKYLRAKKRGYSLISLFERDLIEPRWSQVIKPLLRYLLTAADLQQPVIKFEDISHKYPLKNLARQFLRLHSLHHLQTANKYIAVTNEQNQLIAVYTLTKTKSGYSIKQFACDLSLNIDYQYVFTNLINWLKDNYQQTIKLLLSNNYAESRLITSDHHGEITRPNLWFVNLKDANDYYHRNILSGWSAKSGIIAKDLGYSSNMSIKQVHQYINNKLSHQTDDKHGYLDVYDTGNSIYKF